MPQCIVGKMQFVIDWRCYVVHGECMFDRVVKGELTCIFCMTAFG